MSTPNLGSFHEKNRLICVLWKRSQSEESKFHSLSKGYRKSKTRSREFSRTLWHGNSNIEI